MSEVPHEILEAMQGPVLVIDRSFRIVFANRAARERFGTEARPAVGELCHCASHGLDVPCKEMGIDCPTQKVFATGARARVVHVHRTAEGKPIAEEVIASPLIDADGKVTRVIEEVRNAEELLKSQELMDCMCKEIERLRGLLPTCAECKKIRTADGTWEAMESYIEKRSSARFSHGLCPTCAAALYPQFYRGDGL